MPRGAASGRWRGRLAALLLAGLATPATAQLPAALQRALRDSGVPASAWGAVVAEVGGAPLLRHNADTALNPASVMKLVTTQAALELLGPAHTWRTEVWAAGPLEGERLRGDLVLRGGGDPRLDLEAFWRLLRDLRARGLRHVDGDLVLDRSRFDVPDTDPAAFDGEPTRPYNAGPDALLLNHRAVRLTFVPDAAARSVRILPEPPLEGFQVVNRLVLGDGPCDSWPERALPDPGGAALVFQGTYPLACGEKSRHFMLLPPLDYARALFAHLWSGLGGSFSGRVRQGPVPEGAQRLASAESPPLADVVRDINKHSNNVMARQVFLALGNAGDSPATLERAREAVQAWLAARGVAAPGLVLENGSGLSRLERIAPATLAQLLTVAWWSPVGPELAASLPVAGADGTLRRRFAGGALAGRARLKTGLLDQVRALAGYVHRPDGRVLVVVSIVNHPRARESSALHEALVAWAYDNAGDGTGDPPVATRRP